MRGRARPRPRFSRRRFSAHSLPIVRNWSDLAASPYATSHASARLAHAYSPARLVRFALIIGVVTALLMLPISSSRTRPPPSSTYSHRRIRRVRHRPNHCRHRDLLVPSAAVIAAGIVVGRHDLHDLGGVTPLGLTQRMLATQEAGAGRHGSDLDTPPSSPRRQHAGLSSPPSSPLPMWDSTSVRAVRDAVFMAISVIQQRASSFSLVAWRPTSPTPHPHHPGHNRGRHRLPPVIMDVAKPAHAGASTPSDTVDLPGFLTFCRSAFAMALTDGTNSDDARRDRHAVEDPQRHAAGLIIRAVRPRRAPCTANPPPVTR